MRRRLRIISNTAVLILFIGMGFSSCYESVEACLDSNATNFDVYADENCCCTYPSLNVNMVKVIDGDTLDSKEILADTFTNTLGQKYQIVEQSFYMSNVQLTYVDGSISQVTDTLELEIPLDSGIDVIVEDNFGLVRQSTTKYSAGQIETNGTISNVSFTVGLTDQINMLTPAQLPTTHPLGANNETDHFVEGSGYVYIRWIIKPIEVTGVEEIIVTLSGTSVAQDISLEGTFTTEPGISTEVPLIVDYGKWLQGIDFAADQSIINAAITANTASAFSIL